MRKILLGTTAVVGLALVAQAANAQQARPAARPAPVAAPMAPPALPATSVAPTGTAAAMYQTPVGITGAGPHGADGVPNRPATPTTSGLVVRLGGFFDFSMGNVSDSSDGAWFRNNMAPISFSAAAANGTGGVANTAGTITNAKGRQRNDFRNEAEFNIYVDGVAANGMRYGAVFELQMDNTTVPAGQTSGTGLDYDELYGFVKGGWGEIRFGNEDSAASLMQVRRPSVLWMGTDDAWDEFVVNQPGGTPYIMSGMNDGNDATKLIYLSPQLMGFDAGISYAANPFEGENFLNPTNTTQFQRDFTSLTNQVTGALRYRGTFGDVGLQTSFVAAFADAATLTAAGQSITNKPQNVTAYSAGLVLRAYGFAVGGEYTWGNYNGSAPGNAALSKGLDGSNHWVGSGTYTIGAVSLGAMYGKGTQDNGTASAQTVGGFTQTAGAALEDREQTYLGFGVAYILAPGMTLFANYNQVQDKNIPLNGASVNSAGTGMIAANQPGAGTTLARFNASGSTTRDIQVLVAGVRVAF
jgi:outer membrane protein OmpU